MRGSGGGLRWFWGADGGARAVLVMRGYGKSGEVGGGSLEGSIFGSRCCDLSFGSGGSHAKLKKLYMFLDTLSRRAQFRRDPIQTETPDPNSSKRHLSGNTISDTDSSYYNVYVWANKGLKPSTQQLS